MSLLRTASQGNGGKNGPLEAGKSACFTGPTEREVVGKVLQIGLREVLSETEKEKQKWEQISV